MLKNGKPRIAVCFSGQPRTWRKCVDSWDKNLFGQYEMDVFCHMWDFNTLPNCITVGQEVENTLVPPEEIAELLAILDPVKYKLESCKEFTLMKEDQVVRTPSFISQYYGIMSAARLKREYEIENDFEYDIVIKMRYDAFFESSVIEEFTSPNIDSHSMYCFHYDWNRSNKTGRVGDIFWYAASETYDIMADFFLNISVIEPRLFNLPDGTPNPNLVTESVFYHYIKKNDISFKINHSWNIKLYRESQELAFSEDLNGFEIW